MEQSGLLQLLFGMINKHSQTVLNPLQIVELKKIYNAIGISQTVKTKEEVTQQISTFLLKQLLAPPIQQSSNNLLHNPISFKEGFPLINIDKDIFKNNYIKKIVDLYNNNIQMLPHQMLGMSLPPQINFNNQLPKKQIQNIYSMLPQLQQQLQQHQFQEPTCYCGLSVNSNQDDVVRCTNPQCNRILHSFCMKIKNIKEYGAIFECPDCTLRRSDPLHEVIYTVLQPFVLNNDRSNFTMDNEQFMLIKNNENIGLEIRCIRLEDNSHEQCWPHTGELILNNSKQRDFKPLAANISLKKRRDEKFFTRDVFLGHNTCLIKYQPKIDSRFNVNKKDNETYFAAIYLVKKLTCDELINKVQKNCRRSFEDSKLNIKEHFKSSSLEIDKLQYGLSDIMDFQLIKTPAKGVHCKHVNCFSLENYIGIWQKNSQRKWTCPICRVKAYDLIVDEYFVEVIRTAKELETTNQEVVINSAGEFMFNINKKKDKDSSPPEGEDSKRELDIDTAIEQEYRKESDERKERIKDNKNMVIILDSDEEIPEHSLLLPPQTQILPQGIKLQNAFFNTGTVACSESNDEQINQINMVLNSIELNSSNNPQKPLTNSSDMIIEKLSELDHNSTFNQVFQQITTDNILSVDSISLNEKLTALTSKTILPNIQMIESNDLSTTGKAIDQVDAILNLANKVKNSASLHNKPESTQHIDFDSLAATSDSIIQGYMNQKDSLNLPLIQKSFNGNKILPSQIHNSIPLLKLQITTNAQQPEQSLQAQHTILDQSSGNIINDSVSNSNIGVKNTQKIQLQQKIVPELISMEEEKKFIQIEKAPSASNTSDNENISDSFNTIKTSIKRKFKELKNSTMNSNPKNLKGHSSKIDILPNINILPEIKRQSGTYNIENIAQVIENSCVTGLQFSEFTYELPSYEDFKSKKIKKTVKQKIFKNLNRNKKLIKLIHKHLEGENKAQNTKIMEVNKNPKPFLSATDVKNIERYTQSHMNYSFPPNVLPHQIYEKLIGTNLPNHQYPFTLHPQFFNYQQMINNNNIKNNNNNNNNFNNIGNPMSNNDIGARLKHKGNETDPICLD